MKITLLTLDGFYPIAVEYAFDDGDKSLLEQSYQAFKCDLPWSHCNRAMILINIWN